MADYRQLELVLEPSIQIIIDQFNVPISLLVLCLLNLLCEVGLRAVDKFSYVKLFSSQLTYVLHFAFGLHSFGGMILVFYDSL